MNPHHLFDRLTEKLAKAKIAHFEIALETAGRLKIDAKDAKIDSLLSSQDAALTLRVEQNRQIGFSYSTSFDEDALTRMVETAVSVAELMPSETYHELMGFDKKQYALSAIDEKGQNESREKKVELALALEKACRDADSRIKTVRSASFSESVSHSYLCDHKGTRLEKRDLMYSLSLSCKAEENGDSSMGGEYDFTRELQTFTNDKIKEIAKLAAISATEQLNAKKPTSRKCPAVFRRDVVSSLLDFISGSFSLEQIDKNLSALQGKVGEEFFSKHLTLIDDAKLVGGYSSAPFDDEGVETKTKKLVENGIFKLPINDSFMAKKYNAPRTGNAWRGMKSAPSCGMSNFYIEPKNHSFESLVKTAHNGILITDLMGMHTSNEITGDFSLGASGILIENGELTRPVRGFAVAGNLWQLLKSVAYVGSDLRFYGGTGAVSFLVDSLSIGGES